MPDPFYLTYTATEVQALLDAINAAIYTGPTQPTNKVIWIDTSEE